MKLMRLKIIVVIRIPIPKDLGVMQEENKNRASWIVKT